MMTQNLILALGSNLDDKKANLRKALELLQKKFTLVEPSRIYESDAVENENQPRFYNQVVHFQILDKTTPLKILEICLSVEKEMGRVRLKEKGPRIIDIDIIFIDEQIIEKQDLQVPHPKWKDRSFVVKPLMELAYWRKIKKNFPMPTKIQFQIDAFPLK